jgi:hypothetical protein
VFFSRCLTLSTVLPTQLDLSLCVEVSAEGLRGLTTGCLLLRTLDLTKCYNVDDAAMQVRVPPCPAANFQLSLPATVICVGLCAVLVLRRMQPERTTPACLPAWIAIGGE